MNVAEEVSQDTSYLQDIWKGYYNAKLVNRDQDFINDLKDRYGDRLGQYYGSQFEDFYSKMAVKKNTHFDNTYITLNVSTVHVPTNVFEGGEYISYLL